MKKRILCLLLTSVMMLTIISVPSFATEGEFDYKTGGTTADGIKYNTMYVDLDFESGTKDSTTMTTPNKAATKLELVEEQEVTTYKDFVLAANASYSYRNGATTLGNTTGHMYSERKPNPSPTLTMSLATNEIPSLGTVGSDTENMLVYVDVRMTLPGHAVDQTRLVYYDSTGKEIFQFVFADKDGYNATNTPIPYVATDRAYGTITTDPALTESTYPRDVGWRYFRAVMDFRQKRVSLYHGASLDTLEPMIKNTPTVPFRNTAAVDFTRFSKNNKGGVCLDDIKVYTVIPPPVASNITVSGKQSIGETLTANYGEYTDSLFSKLEGDSFGYWQASDTGDFTDAVQVTDNEPVQEGGNYTLVLDETHTGKYLRYTVVPVNEDGGKGTPVHSNSTVKINAFTFALSTTGSIDGNQFNFNSDANTYKGVVAYSNSSSESKTVSLITAWYRDSEDSPELVATYMDTVYIPAGSEEDTGVIIDTVSNTNGKTFDSSDSLEGLIMKVMAWENVTNRPLSKALVIEGVK